MKPGIRAVAAQYHRWPNLYYYALGKLALDPAYPFVSRALAGSDRPLLDLGCGMGLLTAYLRAGGHRAPVRGIDVDGEKIGIARELLGDERTEFDAGNALAFLPHHGDVVMLDVLHYFTDEEQHHLLSRIAGSVAPGGRALIRLTLRDRSWRFAATRIEEWVIPLTRWIPKSGWNFPSREKVIAPFREAGLGVNVRPMWGLTPFNSYLFEFTR